jgi:hypothetical protein
MNEVLTAAVELQEFLRSKQWSFAVIGGIALIRWGQPRTTVDVDVTLLTGFGEEESFIDELLAKFQSRVEDPKEFAIQNRILLLQSANRIGLDVALGGLPFEERVVSRATEFDVGGGALLVTASAEDLIVLKAFAGRPQDWTDVAGVVIRQGESLDWTLIVDELTPLCELKESPETVDRLLTLRDQMAAE